MGKILILDSQSAIAGKYDVNRHGEGGAGMDSGNVKLGPRCSKKSATWPRRRSMQGRYFASHWWSVRNKMF